MTELIGYTKKYCIFDFDKEWGLRLIAKYIYHFTNN